MTTRTGWTATFLMFLSASCATAGKPAPAATAALAAPTSDATVPTLRLPDNVVPRDYQVDLKLHPRVPTFEGSVTIDVDVRRVTGVVWLNAVELKVSRASITQGGKEHVARVLTPKRGFLGLDVGVALAPGPARLHLEYAGVIVTNDSSGIFHEVEAGEHYLYSEFETADARRAFPSFDEPRWKTSYRLTLHVPATDVALSNTPVTRETPEADGMKAVAFAATKPLPSYLVAFGVGPFSYAEGPPAGKKRVPVRVYHPHGHAHEADLSAVHASELLTRLEDYFQVEYPYEKLDLLAIPSTSSFSAMENPGLVTFVETLLLFAPGEVSIYRERRAVTVMAHELAHQWFGDLVTTAWWDDTWLNEAFATWMEPRIMEAYRPAWNVAMDRFEQRETAMLTDSVVSARQIRQPILSEDDILNAFDPITYEKGSSVIGMFESYLGPEVFRQGVQRHLRTQAFKAATSKDFLGALSAAAGKDVAAPFATFLDQPGLPEVGAALKCTAGAPPSLVLTQKRYLPIGPAGKTEPQWQVPVCTRYDRGGGKGAGTQCNLLTQPEESFVLEGAEGCPTWIYPDANSRGYYRLSLAPELAATLDHAPLTQVERAGVLMNARALMTSGELPPERALPLAAKTVKDAPDDTYLLRSALRLSASVDRKWLSPADARKYAAYLGKLWGPRARALGFDARPGESEALRLLRPEVLEVAALQGRDAATIAEGVRRTKAFLATGKGLNPDVQSRAFGIAARYGDAKLVGALADRHAASQNLSERSNLASGLREVDSAAGFAELTRVVMAGKLTPREILPLILGGSVLESGRTRFEYTRDHFDALAKLLPRDVASVLLRSTYGFCDQARRAELESAFAGRVSTTPGSPRGFAQTLERIDQCTATRAALAPGVGRFLSRG